MNNRRLLKKAVIIWIIFILIWLFFVLTKCKSFVESSAPCRILDFYGVPYGAMLNEMRNVLPTLEPWREVLIHWVDDSGEHRATSYYSYDELHEKALKEVKNVQTIMIFCESTPEGGTLAVPKKPDTRIETEKS